MAAVVALPSKNHSAASCQLVESFVQEDKQGCLSPGDFEVFVRDYAGRLLAVARRFLRREDDAADVVQDALLSALAARGTFQGGSTV